MNERTARRLAAFLDDLQYRMVVTGEYSPGAGWYVTASDPFGRFRCRISDSEQPGCWQIGWEYGGYSTIVANFLSLAFELRTQRYRILCARAVPPTLAYLD